MEIPEGDFRTGWSKEYGSKSLPEDQYDYLFHVECWIFIITKLLNAWLEGK